MPKNKKKHKYKPKPLEEPKKDAGESAAKFKQVEISGKGQGLVATKLLPAGTIVIHESPLITANDGLLRDQEIVAKFREAIQQKTFWFKLLLEKRIEIPF